MGKEKKLNWIAILSVLLVLSILGNIILLDLKATDNRAYQNSFKNLNNGWCDVFNDVLDIGNELIIELRSCDSFYSNLTLFKESNCQI